MAQRQGVSGALMLLYLGTNGTTYDTIVCLTNTTIDRSKTVSQKTTKCGTITTTGGETNSITFDGEVATDPDAGTASIDQLLDYYDNGTNVYYKIAEAVPVEGSITYSGRGIITALNETFPAEDSWTFTGTLSPSGFIAHSTATS